MMVAAATTTLTAELCNTYTQDKALSHVKRSAAVAATSSSISGTKGYVKCAVLANYFRLLSSLYVYRERGAVLDFIVRHHNVSYGNDLDFLYNRKSGAV
jgi:hypothetical protein